MKCLATLILAECYHRIITHLLKNIRELCKVQNWTTTFPTVSMEYVALFPVLEYRNRPMVMFGYVYNNTNVSQ
jgi:hypothetical protein